MVRDQNAGGASSPSSIALLQERFKRLQRMKELRQEKELRRALSESKRRSPPIPISNHYEVQRQTTFDPAKPQCQLSLSLIRPDSQNKRAGSRVTGLVVMVGPSSSSANAANDLTEVISSTSSSTVGFENYSGGADVDTSLRL